jgi:hypothetical protein
MGFNKTKALGPQWKLPAERCMHLPPATAVPLQAAVALPKVQLAYVRLDVFTMNDICSGCHKWLYRQIYLEHEKIVPGLML